MASKTEFAGRFRVGQQVQFLFGLTKTVGTIIEDRGPIGVGGRRLYRIRFQFAADEEPMFAELPAVDLEPANQPLPNEANDS